MKNILVLAALFVSFNAFSQDVVTTIEQIEYDRDAQCFEIKQSMMFCLNRACVNYHSYQCSTTTGNFKVKLKVVTKSLADGSQLQKVKKVKYIK